MKIYQVEIKERLFHDHEIKANVEQAEVMVQARTKTRTMSSMGTFRRRGL